MKKALAAALMGVMGVMGMSWGADGAGRVEVGAVGEVGGVEAPSIERFLRIRAAGMPAVTPEGALLVRDWPDGVNQLYMYEDGVARPGAAAVRLTEYADGLSMYSLSPDGSRVLLGFAAGGNENTQFAVMPTPRRGAAAPRATMALSNPRVQHSVNFWLQDGSGFVYTANDPSPTDFYIYRHDFEGEKRTLLLGREGAWSAQDMTRDGKRLLVTQYISISDSRVYELDVASGNMTELTIRPASEEEGATASNRVVGYMPDERSVLVLSDAEGGSLKLFLRELGTGAVRKALPGLDRYELDSARTNEERTLLAAVTNEDGYGVLYVFRLPEFERVELPRIERGVVSVGQMRADSITWTLNNARTPGLAFTCEVPATGKAGPARQVTFAETQGIDLGAFPLPELVKYKAFDGLEIPAFLFLPAGHERGRPIPFIVNYHGGPESQHRPVFNASNQFLLSRGFGILLPNVRGSTGYGREFHMLDDYKNRWNSVRDGVDGAEWLVKSGYAEAGRIATFGGSYGGFMSVACLVEDQERVDAGQRGERLFGAGVNIVGIVNMRTFLEQTSGYRRKLREAEYGPLTDPEFLASVSPINRIDKINVPMFIAHGLNDPRVPVGEAMQLAIGLMQRGVDPVQFYAPDEGHGFAKLSNRLLFMERVAKFLEETIGR